MQIIISPAKKMKVDVDSFAPEGLPIFLAETERLKTALQGMTPEALQALWRCNDAIARQNVERLAGMDLRRRLTPAILSYEGIQYQSWRQGCLRRNSSNISESICGSCPASMASSGPLTV